MSRKPEPGGFIPEVMLMWIIILGLALLGLVCKFHR